MLYIIKTMSKKLCRVTYFLTTLLQMQVDGFRTKRKCTLSAHRERRNGKHKSKRPTSKSKYSKPKTRSVNPTEKQKPAALKLMYVPWVFTTNYFINADDASRSTKLILPNWKFRKCLEQMNQRFLELRHTKCHHRRNSKRTTNCTHKEKNI